MADLVGRKILNRYRVDESLGRGGMAVVYKVWDEQRAVYLAMKLLREDLAEDRVFLRRFKREGNTLSQLQHPNIVRFYGLEQEGNQAFMLMDFIDGYALRREIFEAKGPMPMARVMEIAQATCSALHFAHNQGFVHSDVKPGNILIDRGGRAHLTDFGIARMTEAATSTMVGIGTPAYMAPEQIRGEDPTPRTDVYSFGVVLYEMVTGGERPFTGERSHTTGSNSEKVRWEHIYLDPPPPSKFNRNLPKAVEAVILRCLSKEPGQRYGSTLELLNALQTAVQGPAKQPAAAPAAPSPTEAPTALDESPAAAEGVTPAFADAPVEAPRRKAAPVVFMMIALLVIVVGALALTSLGGGLRALTGGTGDNMDARVQATLDAQATSDKALSDILTGTASVQSGPAAPGAPTSAGNPAPTSAPVLQPTTTIVAPLVSTSTPTQPLTYTLTIRNNSVWVFVVTLESTGQGFTLSANGGTAFYSLTPGTYRFLWTAPDYPLGSTCGSSTLAVNNTINFNETWVITNGKECASIKNPP